MDHHRPRAPVQAESADLDFESTERLFRKMRQLKKAGASILIVTHRIAELTRIADRATVLRDGVDVGCLEKEEITEARILQLIAGPERERQQQAQPVPERQSDRPILRVEQARVWNDSGAINLALYPGEIVGVTGLDGQGQADFVRSVAGVQGLVSGRIDYIEGKREREISGLSAARENNISYVSGDRKKEGIFPNLSIFENLLMPVYREYRLGGILNLLNRTKLSPIFEWESGKLAVKMGSRDNLITSLSGGNQQKVILAKWLATDPKLLLLDEPTRGIDVNAKREIYAFIDELARLGLGLIVVSSELPEILALADRVLVMCEGRKTAEFARADATAEKILAAAFPVTTATAA